MFRATGEAHLQAFRRKTTTRLMTVGRRSILTFQLLKQVPQFLLADAVQACRWSHRHDRQSVSISI
jgi:hypothetical protein